MTAAIPATRKPDIDTFDNSSQPYNNLLAAVILQAVKDANGKDLKTAIEARRWLYSAGVGWVEYLGVPPEKFITWLGAALPLAELLPY